MPFKGPRSFNFIIAATTMVVALLVGIAAITAAAPYSTIASVSTAEAQQMIEVQAGGGNATAPLTQFIPQKVEINTGQSITWTNPTTVGEPHTVTFVLDNKTMTGVVSPLAIPNSTQFTPIPPGSNNQPVMMPGKSIVIALNARSYTPTVIDSQGNVKMFASPNAKYTFSGSDKYVNSGWILPKGQEQLYPGSGNTFTVTFQKPGTYDYICILHPWMTGQVVVK
ncbi:MAG: plastocyanin/azurin family copper-binding protein [Nitrososphaeraceae archaeon]